MPKWISISVLVMVLVLVASPASAGSDDGLDVPYSPNLVVVDPALWEMLDSGEEELPVIVIFKDGMRKKVDGFEVGHLYSLVNGMSGYASPSVVERLIEDKAVAGVYLDGFVSAAQPVEFATDNRTVCAMERVNASLLWEEGIDGSGVVVAVLDSGIDENHPDLAGRVIGEKNFVDSERTTDDLLGHGTAVAGLIAGSGAASGGRYKGVAPGASLLNVRVIDSRGAGQISDIIAGIEWALENDADVLSMSLGGINLGETNPPISLAADNAMDSGTVVCVAAGNLDERLLFLMMIASSVCLGCVESPGDGVNVITVGATDCDNRIALFSGSGPLSDGRNKPTLVAPGVNVVSTVPPDVEVGGRIDPYYASSSGTSLATPVVAGVAALVLQADPGLSPAGVKAALTRGALKLDNTLGEEYEAYYQGAGLVDALGAYDLLEEGHLCNAMPDRWSAGRSVYADFHMVDDSAIYSSLDTGADRSQKEIYALAPGDVDWTSKLLFLTDKELEDVKTTLSGPVTELASLQPLPGWIPANGQRIFGVSVSVPDDAEPGLYAGAIDVSEKGAPILSVPISVEVAVPIEIEKGRGTGSGELEKNEWHYYYVDVPPSTDDLSCTLSWGGNSDLDLFMLAPTSEYYPAEQGDRMKTVSVTEPSTGRWMLAVHPRNITEGEGYLLEVERSLLKSTPKRWSLGSVVPGETKIAQFSLDNDGPDLLDLAYEGVVEGVRRTEWNDTVGDKMIWSLPIDVTSNATRLSIKLRWDDPDTVLALLLFNPSGRPVDVSYASGDFEEVGATRPTPGKWRVWVYGYDVSGAIESFEMEEVLYTQESWSWISADGPSKLESETDGKINATISIPNEALSREVEGYIQIRTQNESFAIPVSLTVAGAHLTGEGETDLVDEDGDGLFERLCFGMGVNVKVPGDYRLEGSLVDGTGTAIGWMSSTERLEEDGSIEICVEGGQIWKKGDCGPLKLENLLLYNDEGDIIDRYEGEILVFQCPADFQPVSAQFTGDFVDETETMANRIVIGVEVSIQTPGEYVISGLLEDDDGFEIDSVEKGVDLVAGEQTVLLEFNPIRFIMKQKESRLHLKDLLLSRDGEEIDRLEDAWSTEVYAPGDFTTIRKTYVI